MSEIKRDNFGLTDPQIFGTMDYMTGTDNGPEIPINNPYKKGQEPFNFSLDKSGPPLSQDAINKLKTNPDILAIKARKEAEKAVNKPTTPIDRKTVVRTAAKILSTQELTTNPHPEVLQEALRPVIPTELEHAVDVITTVAAKKNLDAAGPNPVLNVQKTKETAKEIAANLENARNAAQPSDRGGVIGNYEERKGGSGVPSNLSEGDRRQRNDQRIMSLTEEYKPMEAKSNKNSLVRSESIRTTQKRQTGGTIPVKEVQPDKSKPIRSIITSTYPTTPKSESVDLPKANLSDIRRIFGRKPQETPSGEDKI